MKTSSLKAKDKDQNNVYVMEASAGSGKTYNLAKRYVKLLLDGGSSAKDALLRNILAITFTNKASMEMRNRILEFLKKIALDSFQDEKEKKDIIGSLTLKKKELRDKAETLMDVLIRDYDHFQVQTIDSFINAVLNSSSLALGLPAGFRIKKDYEEYLEYSLDRLLDKAGDDKKVLAVFKTFLRQYLFVENKEGWYPKKDITKLLASLFIFSNKYGCGFAKYGKTDADIIKKKRYIYGLVRELEEKLTDACHKRFRDGIANFLAKNPQGFDIGALKGTFKNSDIPVKKGCKEAPEAALLWRSIRDSLRELCEWQSFSMFDCYVDIYDMAYGYFRDIASKEDVIFLSELNSLANKLFSDKLMTMEEFFYRMSAKFTHILIDEFQDTSILQWKNFTALIKDALSRRGTFFYVGDKKQAIYRFRGGEAELFDKVALDLSGFGLKKDSLKVNYRSRKEIVDFNNTVFSADNLARFLEGTAFSSDKDGDMGFDKEDVSEVLNVFGSAPQIAKSGSDGGYVNVEIIEGESKEDSYDKIKERLKRLIKDLKGRYPLGDMAVLTRKNDEVEYVTSWLLEENIPVNSDKTLNIREYPRIKEIMALLKFLNSPIDDLSFAAFILGMMFSSACGVSGKKMHEFIFNIGRKKKKEHLYKEFQAAFPDVWDAYISGFFKTVGAVPVYEFVVNIISKFRPLETFPESQAYFMRFLELIKDKEKEHRTLSSFLEFFETAEDDDLYVRIKNENAVNVTTIHKAKGLEYGLVIIPFLAIETKVDHFQVKYDEALDKANLVHLRKDYRAYSPEILDIHKKEYKKVLIDELNNIYVALTRAKNGLYVMIPPRSGRQKNIALDLIPENCYRMGRLSPYNGKTTEKEKTLNIPAQSYGSWVKLVEDKAVKKEELQARKSIRNGEVAHYMLSLIGNLSGVRDPDKTVSGAVESAKCKYRHFRGIEDIGEKIKNMVRKKELRVLFFVEDGDVYTEREIVTKSGETKRLDRLVIKKDECGIFDYKSSHESSDKHEIQMREYISIMKDIKPKHRTKGFIVYLDDLSIKEVA